MEAGRKRTAEQIAEEIRRAQADAASVTFTIHGTLTFDQLRALNEHIDRFVDEKFKQSRLTEQARHELEAMMPLLEAWPYRWREDRFR